VINSLWFILHLEAGVAEEGREEEVERKIDL